MRAFLFRCPRTGLMVQGFIADDAAEPGDDDFVQVKCNACGSHHFVNPRTNSVQPTATKPR